MEEQKMNEKNEIPGMASCRRKKREDATFMEDLKDHIDEFMNASMDEHVSCFKKTMNKMFGMTRAVAEKDAATESGGASSAPLQRPATE